MKATSILILHTSLFFIFASLSLSSPILVWLYPDVLPGKYLVAGALVLALLVRGSWPLYDGKCPFTVWENRYRQREGTPTYSEPCIDHYATRWFGIGLPQGLSTKMLIVLLVLPIVVGALNW